MIISGVGEYPTWPFSRCLQGSVSVQKGDGKRGLPAAPEAAIPTGTSFAVQTPSRLLPPFLHVLPSPFEDAAVEQAYQAHFDRLKVRSRRCCLCVGHSHHRPG